ncbi:error-prone DNA polymerase domain protein [Mycobacterium xenopi 4042]|uniref:Error-prone DNA polymerase domain protein n=1 Tax=Mycobacterium xenopi 4042 TaxID=1299334 RepID=X7YJU8_MYCXE|nr:error-prone DNA polymerase domain protein [Mycobacterium xenopi 4042]
MARRVGLVGAGAGSQGQFGAEHGMHVQFRGRLGEPHRTVETVVIGQRDRAQIQPRCLFDQLLGCAGPSRKL